MTSDEIKDASIGVDAPGPDATPEQPEEVVLYTASRDHTKPADDDRETNACDLEKAFAPIAETVEPGSKPQNLICCSLVSSANSHQCA